MSSWAGCLARGPLQRTRSSRLIALARKVSTKLLPSPQLSRTHHPKIQGLWPQLPWNTLGLKLTVTDQDEFKPSER